MMLSMGKHLQPGLWLTPNWPRNWQKTFNPLSPTIHIQIPQTDLHTFPLRIS